MTEKTSFVYVTYIRATAEAVFAALKTPEITRRYWGHENVSEWTPGAEWRHVRDSAERPVNIVGEVVEVSPPHRLVITWADPAKAQDPANISRVTFEIVDYDDMVRLTVSHDELTAGSSMASGISKGWPSVLSSLKSFLETGTGIDVFAKPKSV